MRTLFSGEELNRFLDDSQDFTLSNGDMFFLDDYFPTEDLDDFIPAHIYDISKLSTKYRKGSSDDELAPSVLFADCFYAWACQVAKDIPLTNPDYFIQPEPIKNDLPAVWDLVIHDMQNRDKVGQERYGTRLQPNNGRDVLRDISEELLDALVYIRSLMYERDGK